MAIHIQSGKNNLECNLKNSKIQSLPCKIHADCDAPVSKYFEPYVTKEENNLLSGSFRGYPLKGKKMELPEGYIGVVLHESIRPTSEKDERKFYLVNKFKDVVYWNWDTIPSKNDAFIKALAWVEIAEVLHSPILEE